MAFVKATKGKKPARIVLGGPSGAGKSFTALTFARYLEKFTGKPTAAIDTEHYRLSLYADIFSFDVNNWEPPFDPRELIKTIHDVEKENYGTLIVDSATHFYNAPGGLLEIVSDAAKQKYGGNQYAGWAAGTPVQDALIDAIIRSPLHMIFCTRAKQGYAEVEKNGRKVYEKVGMELQQRDGWEFDFDFALIMDMENNASVSKGMGYIPTGMYIKKPDETTIEKIIKSINDNTTNEVAVPPVKFVKPTPEEVIKGLRTDIGNLYNEVKTEENVETLKTLLKKYEPKGGNPNAIKDVSELEKLKTELEVMKEEK
jgi:energy-coupling factor transporter ATP-binding protein EcfA2